MELCCSAEALFAAKRQGILADLHLNRSFSFVPEAHRKFPSPWRGRIGRARQYGRRVYDVIIVHIAHPLEHEINVDVRPHVFEEQQESPRPPVMCRQPLQAVQA